MTTNTPLRVGIAGYGVVGKRRRTFIDQHPDLQTVAVCDRFFGAPGKFEDGVPYFTHYTELLEQDLNVLFVCLTNDVAAEVCVHGLESGLNVFCEKPPGRDLIDMARVKRVADKHPELCLKYGFNHRYHKSVLDALELLNSGNLGRVVDMRGVYGKSRFISFKEDSGWRTQRDIAGGGILLDQGIHMVDLMRLFAGEFVDIHSFISNDYWNHDVEDNAYAIMRTAKGQVAMLQSSATQWRHRFNLDITCERGGLILSGILSGSKSYGAETLTVVWKADDDAGDPKEVTTRYNEDPSWESEIDEFADAVLRGGEIVSGSIDDAVATMSLVYRIYCADQTWRDRFQLTDQLTN